MAGGGAPTAHVVHPSGDRGPEQRSGSQLSVDIGWPYQEAAVYTDALLEWNFRSAVTSV